MSHFVKLIFTLFLVASVYAIPLVLEEKAVAPVARTPNDISE